MHFEQGMSDEDMMHFQTLSVSPAKSDASSIDIYDGLDMQTSTEQAAEKNSPSRSCLDLYEEILTEEGTAKEASFSDLSDEYEKCQRQMKKLITKLKDMQSLNSNLQNENQCLKKNISALIKTARVEITRKEEEINRLNQRSGAPYKNHSLKLTSPSLHIHKSKSNDDLSKNVKSTVSLSKETTNLLSKAVTISHSKNLSDKEKTCMESGQTCTSINSIAKHCKNTVHRPQEQTSEPPFLDVNDRKKKEMDLDTLNKDCEKNRAKERPKSSCVSSVSESKSPLKCRKNKSSQESRKSKSEVGCETENRKYHSSSTKEKTQLKDLDYSKEKQVKRYDRSPHRKESRKYEKEKNTESRHRTPEKNEEPRRSKRTHFSPPKGDGSVKLLELSGIRKSSDAGRKDKRFSEYRESRYGSKDLKPSNTENSTRNKPDGENKTERSYQDRRGVEKKRARDEADRSRHDRKDTGHQTKNKDAHQSSSKDKALHFKVSEKDKNSEKAEVGSIQKDLKLSFMETLNLTISPAKKTSATSSECEVDGNLAVRCSQICITENNADTLCPEKTDLRHGELVSMAKTTNVLNTEDSKLVSKSGHLVDKIGGKNKQAPNSEVENSESLAKLTVEDELISSTVLDTASSKEMGTHSIVDSSDLVDLDSFIEIDRCSGSPCSENNASMPAEQIESDGSILERSEDVDKKTFKLKSDLTETPKGICESPYTEFVNVSTKGIENKPCFHDESSIDLNFLRPIPTVLSPLKSPARPKALHTLEHTAKASVVSVLYKELLPETNTKSTHLSVSEELNKENCQPDNKSDCGIKPPALAASDEVEEGEILSEDEQMCTQTTQTISRPNHMVPDQVISVAKSDFDQDGKLPLSKQDILIIPPEKSATKHKAKINTRPKISAFPASSQKKPSSDSCLDGILKIVTPSSIQDILQMLRIIRKHVRKKYMKFKILFSVKQFHRVIETATLCFITLVRSLDWSSLCSSPEILQKKLCRHIETRMQTLKKNGTVDRIFEHHVINMKKILWNFVEEQLDSLFDILKTVILKLCDKVEIEKNASTSTNTSKSDPVKSSQNRRSKRISKLLPSSESVSSLKQLELHSQARVSNPKTQNDDSVQKKLVKELTGIGFNSENVDISSTSKLPHLSPAKTFASDEPCPKGQLSSSGLSFNLVSDDHMGDIFKSLLHDSDNLPSNTLPESMWILRTPEKTVSSFQKCHNGDSLSQNKMPREAAFSWSSTSPPHIQIFSRIETVLNPDVFDESCLLEVPTSASSSMTLNGSDNRLKSYSSVLMEDLAVSLTVPSPLKSDSHLSFLRPVCDVEPVSEVDVKCCEGSALDEEDATEQDIHLTLDSDNSSIGSLEDADESGSFQYDPSEPMQAVIMEKSNDHFIVKIRRAVSSGSPICDCSSEGTGNAALESLPTVEVNKLEMEVGLDTKSEAYNGRILLHPDHIDLANVTENSITDINRPERVSIIVQENDSVFKVPPSRNQNLEISAGSKLTGDIVEQSEINCENVTNCIEETCSPVQSAETLFLKTSDANTVALNLKKKKRKSGDESSAKRQKKASLPDKGQGTERNKIEGFHLERSNRKKPKRAVSDGAINFDSSKVSPSSLSAKNVVKKRGEVVVSWTRDEDRAILMECQKIGPTKKAFNFLSSTMNKYPHQVEERFRQLMKLFKKSKNSSS